MHKGIWPGIARVAATYAGTIIGAGFASGQEVVQFFVNYGTAGIGGIIAATLLFAWLGGVLLELGSRLRATSYHQAIYHICGPRIGLFLDFATAAFLFAALSIMLAGAATVGRDYFNIPYLAGLGVMGLAVVLTTMEGVSGIATANLIVTPLLVASVIGVGSYSLSSHGFDPTILDLTAVPAQLPAPHWLLSGLLYVSYNLMVGSTVLVPLGHIVKERRIRLLGGVVGGLTLGFLATFLALVVMLHYPEILVYEVPILEIAAMQHPLSSALYAFTLLAAMFTTAIASLYGCAGKLADVIGLAPRLSILIVTVAAVICGQVGFASLISLLFPVFGYATLIFTFRLAWLACRGKRWR